MSNRLDEFRKWLHNRWGGPASIFVWVGVIVMGVESAQERDVSSTLFALLTLVMLVIATEFSDDRDAWRKELESRVDRLESLQQQPTL